MRFVHAMQSNLQFASRHRYMFMYARVRNCRLDPNCSDAVCQSLRLCPQLLTRRLDLFMPAH